MRGLKSEESAVTRSTAEPRNELVITGARIVAPDRVIEGAVLIRDGVIEDVSSGRSAAPGALDIEGDYLLPGLVELHTDALERHLRPRPGADWPIGPAAIAYDAEFAALGVTTVFDSFRIGSHMLGGLRDYAERAVATIDRLGELDLLKAEHFLHLRCEICAPTVLEEFETLAEHPRLRLISLMDHTVGQRQFRHEEMNRKYFLEDKGLTEEGMAEAVAESRGFQDAYAATFRAALAARAEAIRAEGGFCAVAGHDDATAEDVAESVAAGATIAEFPTTPEAARLAREAGQKILMGAPNLLRGGSHSGNVSARALASEGLLDILSSDYAPSSLMTAAFMLAEQAAYGLPRAIETVTRAPALAAGLGDRGAIEPGLRADLVRARRADDLVAALGVWSAGRRVG